MDGIEISGGLSKKRNHSDSTLAVKLAGKEARRVMAVAAKATPPLVFASREGIRDIPVPM